MGSDEDTSADKVVASPLTTQSKMPGLQDLELLKRAMKVLEIGPHTTPSRPPRGPRPNYGSVDYTEAFGVENSFFTPSTGPGDELPSPSDTDLRVAQKDFDRDSYIPVDEQIVNVCLDTLLMGLCWVLGYSDRISSERPGFAIPKNSKTNLYKAHVDGLIKRDDGKHPIAFMEVKKALRSTNVAVRRQIGAQMCGFIHAHDADIHVRDEDVFTSRYQVPHRPLLVAYLLNFLWAVTKRDRCGWSLWTDIMVTSLWPFTTAVTWTI